MLKKLIIFIILFIFNCDHPKQINKENVYVLTPGKEYRCKRVRMFKNGLLCIQYKGEIFFNNSQQYIIISKENK